MMTNDVKKDEGREYGITVLSRASQGIINHVLHHEIINHVLAQRVQSA